MKRVQFALFLTLLMLCSVLSGCFGEEEKTAPSEPSPFDFDRDIPSTTWYHYSGGVNALNASAVQAANITANLTGDNAPYWATGSYYGIGMSTFEPTIGITSDDNLYMTSWGNGPLGSTAIVQCSGLIEMSNLSDYSCVDTYDPLLPVPNSNDPYVLSLIHI